MRFFEVQCSFAVDVDDPADDSRHFKKKITKHFNMGMFVIWDGEYWMDRSPEKIGDRDRNPVLMCRILGGGDMKYPIDLGMIEECTVRDALHHNRGESFAVRAT